MFVVEDGEPETLNYIHMLHKLGKVHNFFNKFILGSKRHDRSASWRDLQRTFRRWASRLASLVFLITRTSSASGSEPRVEKVTRRQSGCAPVCAGLKMAQRRLRRCKGGNARGCGVNVSSAHNTKEL